MSDCTQDSARATSRQALATLFAVAAGQLASGDSDVPPAFAMAIAGSLRHRANKFERCEVAELREIAAAVRAFAELVVVCDSRMARSLQGVAFCVDVQIDKEVNACVVIDPRIADPFETYPFDGWRECSDCKRQFLFRHAHAPVVTCWKCSRLRLEREVAADEREEHES